MGQNMAGRRHGGGALTPCMGKQSGGVSGAARSVEPVLELKDQ